MNLRVIKKDIEYFVGEFIDDCTLFAALNPDKNNEDLAKIIDEAVDLYNNLKDKVNHPAKDIKPSLYYKGITKELFNLKKRMGVKTPAAQAMLKQCFRTLNMAAVSLQRITDDCALMEANELSEQEM